MIKTPILINKDFKREDKPPFFASQVTLIGLTYYPGKYTKDFGRVALMFLLTDKMDSDNCLFVQTLFDLTSKEEVEFVKKCPANVNNFTKEHYEKVYIPLAAKSIPGENSYGSSMEFAVPKLPTNNIYYEFECICDFKDTKTAIVRRVNISKADYIRLSQVLYWFATGFPFLFRGHDIFYDQKYRGTDILNVTNIIFDGSTEAQVSANNTMIMAHFTIYTDDLLKQNQFGINIPCAPMEKLLHRHPIDGAEYEALYKDHDTISPERIFMFTSPTPAYALLSGDFDKPNYRVFKVDIDVAEKIHWLDWGYYIFHHSEDRKKDKKGKVIQFEGSKI